MIIKVRKTTCLNFLVVFYMRQYVNVGCFFYSISDKSLYMAKVSKIRKNNDMLLIFVQI